MSHHEKTIDPVLDYSTFRRRAGNNVKYIREHIDLFHTIYPLQLAEVRHAARDRNAEALRSAARDLKSTVGNFAAEPAMRAAAVLEEKGSRGDLRGIDECCNVVEYEVERLCDTLKTYHIS